MRRAIAFSLTAFLLFTVSCRAGVVKVGEKESGSSVELSIGDTLEVTLKGNPTTGYSWEVSQVDAAIVKQEGEPGYKSDSNLIGSGGVFTFRFTAVAAGTTALKLIYRRPWEKGIQPARTFDLTVRVK